MTSSDSHPTASELRPSSEGHTSVYKYYDAHKILIYVGITKTGIGRNRQHNSDKAWWPFVADQTVEHFDSREDAHLREVALIQQYRPPFNKQHNADHDILRDEYVRLQQNGELNASVKILASSGEKRWIRLHPLTRGEDPIFLTRLCDSAVARALEHVANVPILRQSGMRIGKILRITKDGAAAKVFTKMSLPPGKRSVKGASARVVYVVKEPVKTRFSRVFVDLD